MFVAWRLAHRVVLASVGAMLSRRSESMVLAGAVAFLAASCVRYGLVRTDEYIGPAGPPTPAAEAPAKTAKGPSAPGAAARPGEEPAAPSQPAAMSLADAVPPEGPISLAVTQAVLLALQNNQALAVERTSPAIFRTFVEQQRAVFDPVLTGALQRDRVRAKTQGPAHIAPTLGQADSIEVGATRFLPTGTQVDLAASTDITHSGAATREFFATRYGLTVTQALLRGYGTDVNLASLRQARVDVLASQYELRGFAEALVAQVEQAYWDYVLAQRNIEIFTQSLGLAEQQLRETEERIRVGKLAEVERAAAEAEVALRREDLINANSALDTAKLVLLRLVNPAKADFWGRDVAILTPPVAAPEKLEDVQSHVRVAERLRPDLNQARLQVQRGDLEIVKTKNGLLPRLDLFLALGKTGYSNSFDGSYSHMHGAGYDVLVGVTVEYPPLNRDARAANQRAHLTRRQAAEAVANLAQLVEVDVRGAHIEVRRSEEQVAATAATRKAQEEKLRAETEKFRVGKSTTLLVAQAQRDLLASQISEVEAVVANLKAWVDFYRLEGSLLERRGVQCPGREPVELPPPGLP
ncbi:MAG: TolC family protein [Planctomycetes bacterium]|nr:TolC family protein [Planctomycetota bacterium]